MLIKNKLRKEITPNRVFVVLKLIGAYDGKINKEQIYNLIQPQNIAENNGDVKKVIKFLQEEKMIVEDSFGKLSANIEKRYLSELKSFRAYVSENIFSEMKEESLFFEATKEILAKDKGIYEVDGFEELALNLETNIDKEFILAWRFWAEFIGIGKVMNRQFLVNPYQRIEECLLNKIEKNEFLVSEFLIILKERCNEFENVINGNNIGLALSVALRTLEKLGKIQLVNIKDSSENWKLYYSSIDAVEITNIRVLKEKK